MYSKAEILLYVKGGHNGRPMNLPYKEDVATLSVAYGRMEKHPFIILIWVNTFAKK